MIESIGCDIISISRIKKAIDQWGDKFLQRIFTEQEIINSKLRPKLSYNYFAKRFAAKEAIAKALKSGIGAHISFNEIEILNDDKGAPYCNILRSGIQNIIHISLSDDQDHALAFIVLEKQ